jgi:DNA methylase
VNALLPPRDLQHPHVRDARGLGDLPQAHAAGVRTDDRSAPVDVGTRTARRSAPHSGQRISCHVLDLVGKTRDEKPRDVLRRDVSLAAVLKEFVGDLLKWHKPNAMPESVTDRCTTAHSYVFLFSKKPRYWFDADAIAEPAAWERWGDQTVPKHEGTPTASGWVKPNTKKALLAEYGDVSNHRLASTTQNNHSRDLGRETGNGMKNPRSVWTIPTRGFPGAHFATWPETLAERIVKAGCPEWVCGTCGVPRMRLVVSEYEHLATRSASAKNLQPDIRRVPGDRGGIGAQPVTANKHVTTVGWSDCGHGDYTPGVILDPFGGSGTTALVARRHGRRSILVELNESYAAMAAERSQQLSLLAEVNE